MSMSDYLENAIASLLFQAQTIPNLADDAGTAPLTELWLSLHTADPTESGDQESNEATYTGYQRIAVDRDSGGWTVTGPVVNPASAINFDQCTAGVGLVETITHATIGTDATGPGNLLLIGTVTPNIPVFNGTTPSLPTTSTITFA